MMFDRVQMKTSTSGTGAYTLSAIGGVYRSLTDALTSLGLSGPIAGIPYHVVDAAGIFEEGYGTFDGGDQLTRDKIEDCTGAAGAPAAYNWGSQEKNVIFGPTAGLANRLEDIVRCGIAGGSANALTLIPPVPIAVRAAGRVYFVTPSSTNTGPTTAKPSELPAAAIQLAGAALVGGEIIAGRPIALYDDGTNFQLLQIAGPSDLPGQVAFTGIITPAQIAGDMNDYDPVDSLSGATFGQAYTVRLSSDAEGHKITGLTGGRAGRQCSLENAGGFGIILPAKSAGSAAANQFGYPADLYLSARTELHLAYDAGLSRWMPRAMFRPHTGKRQVMLAAPLNTDGSTNLGGSTGSATVTAAGTVLAAFASGFDVMGAVDFIASITDPSWAALNTGGDGTKQLYLVYDPATGTISTASASLLQVISSGAAAATTAGQFTFNRGEYRGYLGNGSTAPQVWRLAVGEVTVALGVVSAITWYRVGADIDFASQSLMETAASLTAYASPGNLKFHPGIAKYIGLVNGTTGAITNIYSAAGTPACSRTGTGQYAISGMQLSAAGIPVLQALDADRVATPLSITGNGFNVVTRSPGGSNADVNFYFAIFGDL